MVILPDKKHTMKTLTDQLFGKLTYSIGDIWEAEPDVIMVNAISYPMSISVLIGFEDDGGIVESQRKSFIRFNENKKKIESGLVQVLDQFIEGIGEYQYGQTTLELYFGIIVNYGDGSEFARLGLFVETNVEENGLGVLINETGDFDEIGTADLVT